MGTNFPDNDAKRIFRILGSAVAPGDSLLFYDEIWLHKNIEQESLSLFFTKRVSVYSVVNSLRPLVQEVYPGTINNSDNVNVYYTNKKVGVENEHVADWNIYPNPIASGSVLMIEGSMVNNVVSVKLVDILGKTVSLEEAISRSGNTLNAKIPEVLSGFYYVMVISEEYSRCYKLLIE